MDTVSILLLLAYWPVVHIGPLLSKLFVPVEYWIIAQIANNNLHCFGWNNMDKNFDHQTLVDRVKIV